MGVLSSVKNKVSSLVSKVEDRNDRRAGEIFASIVKYVDESDAVAGLTEDALDAVAKRYELVISLRKK